MAGFSEALLQWFDEHGRKHLPWQKRLSLYRVWVSEIMLQQTQVKGVIPYFQRFMTRFPTLAALAAAPLDEVLHCWTGLGYYARARNLHQAALRIRADYQGRFPKQLQQVMDLPGIGRSTAGAILALAANQRHPILDGNVKRVLCRRYAVEGHPEQTTVKAKLWNYAERLTPKVRVAEYTQAIMDLGATVCTRTQPRCDECPVRAGCRARMLKRVSDFPVSKPKRAARVKTTHFLIMHNDLGQVLLELRPARGIWGGLFSFPEVVFGDHQATPHAIVAECATRYGFRVVRQEQAPRILHKFTHFDLEIIPVHLWSDAAPSVVMDSSSMIPSPTRGRGAQGRGKNTGPEQASRMMWYPSRSSTRVGLATPVKQLLELIGRENNEP